MEPGRDKTKAVRPNSQLIWELCNDNREWEAARVALLDTPAATPYLARRHDKRFLRRVLALALTALLLTTATGWWLWQRAEAGLLQTQSELKSAIIAELWSSTYTPSVQPATLEQETFYDLLAENQTRGEQKGQEEVTEVTIHDTGKDWAVVQLLFHLQGEGPLYRQTRLYRYIGNEWRRAAASAALWGQARRLESAHFTFNYRSLDQEAVENAAPRIETIYRRLYQDYFGIDPGDEKMSVAVDPECLPLSYGSQSEVACPKVAPQSDIVIGSPAAALAPSELSMDDWMTQAVALALINRLSTAADTRYELNNQWHSLQSGLKLWLLWDEQLPLARWRRPVVQLIFSEPLSEIAPEAVSLPEFGYSVCVSHSLWLSTPLEIGIPLDCSNSTMAGNPFQYWKLPFSRSGQIPLLSLLQQRHSYDLAQAPADTMTDIVMLSTMVDYIVATFGRDRLPELLAGLPQHESGATLIPELFGKSPAEFEEGWREFLASQYGVAE